MVASVLRAPGCSILLWRSALKCVRNVWEIDAYAGEHFLNYLLIRMVDCTCKNSTINGLLFCNYISFVLLLKFVLNIFIRKLLY